MMAGMVGVQAQGIPFFRNYLAAEYNGPNQNFDIITGADGTIYVANFEGLLYYDNAEWRMIHTPGITRITAVFRDSRKTIWTGGYNYIGYLETGDEGQLQLHGLQNYAIHGEVQWIWEKEEKVYFLTSSQKIYRVEGETIVLVPDGKLPSSGFATLSTHAHINQVQQLENGLQALATSGEGVIFIDKDGQRLFSINEDNGLCSNNVAHITYNKMGQLWGATDNGIFAIDVPSIYSRFTQHEGLRSEVMALHKLGNEVYAGTLSGLYKKTGRTFTPVKEISHTCWQIIQQNDHLLVASMDGVFRVNANGSVQQLTTASVLSLLDDGEGFYSGEMDGLYYNMPNGKREKLNDIEKVVKILRDRQDDVWLQTIYGKIWKSNGKNNFIAFTSEKDIQEVATLVQDNGNVKPILANTVKPFPYPQFSYTDKDNAIWLTDNKGRDLYAYKDDKVDDYMSMILEPFKDYSIRAMMEDKNVLWMGGERGITMVKMDEEPILMKTKPQILIRSIYIGGDSLLYGGYGEQITTLKDLPSHGRHLFISYSLNFPTIIGKAQYRYRINGTKWSAWDDDNSTELFNQPYGKNTLEIQGRDAWGRTTGITLLTFIYDYPLYLRWYMIVLYVIGLSFIILVLVRLRLRKLEKDKQRLENLVKDRTAEVVRLEKIASVGKLTQGLIDRILNPLNYINNFAKLSEGLVKDVTANIEDEKDHMDPENYEDTMDVLSMLKGNLEKVGEHGANTTRTLKAMEEMLKDRSGGMVNMDLNALMKQDKEMLLKYYEQNIAEHHIRVLFNLPEAPMMINGNAEQLSKTVMSLLGNAVYAVMKKCGKNIEGYTPEISLTLRQQGKQATIIIHDNGTGISENIIHKIFDPFFTTKTTAEASGVGLYLSKEIAQNHGGDISVVSTKDEYTEFTIHIPTL
jgi:signal transduction histidine kinase/ligand-binding sensor domain-containing protein